MSPGGRSGPGRAPSVKKGHPKMKHHSVSEPPPPAPAPTLQNVVDLVGGNPELSETRRRDLHLRQGRRRATEHDPNGSGGHPEDIGRRRADAGQGVPETMGQSAQRSRRGDCRLRAALWSRCGAALKAPKAHGHPYPSHSAGSRLTALSSAFVLASEFELSPREFGRSIPIGTASLARRLRPATLAHNLRA